MRILYILPRTTPTAAERERVHVNRQQILQRAASHGTTVDVRELEDCPPAIESAKDGYLVSPGIIEMAETLEPQYDAMIVGCFGDPAVDAAIEVTSIPIVGCALPAMTTSLILGNRFAVLSPTESSSMSVRRMVMTNGLLDRFAGSVPVGMGVREFTQDPERALDVSTVAGQKALDLGADVLVLGCLSLAFTNAGDELQGRLDVPVVNPLRVAVQTCELLINSGLSPSRRYAGISAAEPMAVGN
jgi:allantoin racemase